MIDFMPISAEILGFSNIWYTSALQHSETIEVSPGLFIRLVTAPYFVATKIEAFRGRGNNDFRASHDLEDIITLIDGRKELLAEIRSTSPGLRQFLADAFSGFLANPEFTESISGHLLPDKASQGRLPLIMRRITQIAENRIEE